MLAIVLVMRGGGECLSFLSFLFFWKGEGGEGILRVKGGESDY